MPASTLSHHLKRLVDAGVIRSRGEGTFHYYSVDYDALRKLTDYLWEDCCKNGAGSGNSAAEFLGVQYFRISFEEGSHGP